MNNEADMRLSKVEHKLTYAYMNVDEIMRAVYRNDYDPRLVRVRRHRTQWHLDRLVEQDRAEVREVGNLRLYRRKEARR